MLLQELRVTMKLMFLFVYWIQVLTTIIHYYLDLLTHRWQLLGTYLGHFSMIIIKGLIMTTVPDKQDYVFMEISCLFY
ncbi:hypothetical protein ESCOCP320M_18110 [Escherichia coli]